MRPQLPAVLELSAPLRFLFPKQIQSALTVSHQVPPDCEYHIPYAIPTLTQWPGGSMLEQVASMNGYGCSLLYFSIDEAIMLEPLAAMNFNTIQYTLKGSCHCLLRGHGIIPLLQNSYTPLYIPEGRHKVWFRPGRYVFLYIVISTEHLKRMAEDHPPLKTLIQKILSASKDGTMMERMPADFSVMRIIKEMEQCEKTGVGLELEMEGYIFRLLAAYDDHLRKVKIPQATKSKQEQAHHIGDYICKYYHDTEKLRIETIADQFFVSVSSLERNFKKYFSISPSEYIREIRLHVAHDLLTTQNIPVQLVAKQVGYQHVSSFCREYKKMYGFSPKGKQE